MMKQTARSRHASGTTVAGHPACMLDVLAIAVASAIALPAAAVAQQPKAVSAWTRTACQMEIERRGWRITANESPRSASDGWLWFRVATDANATADAMCGEPPQGGVSLEVLSAPSAGDVSSELLASCGAALEKRGWTRAGGASTARSGGTILVQHTLADAKGAEGVGHCIYEHAATASSDGESADGPSAPVPTAVTAELISPAQGIDAACRATFQQLGWTATPLHNRQRTERIAWYLVTGRTGAQRATICRYDTAAETVQIEVAK